MKPVPLVKDDVSTPDPCAAPASSCPNSAPACPDRVRPTADAVGEGAAVREQGTPEIEPEIRAAY